MPGTTGKRSAPADIEDIGMEYPQITEVYGGEDMMDDPDVREVLVTMADGNNAPANEVEREHDETDPHQPGKPRRGKVHVHVHRSK